MTSQEFEDKLDDYLHALPRGGGADPWEELPADLRELVQSSPRYRQLLADRLWLHQTLSRHATFRPSPGFADRVVAAWNADLAGSISAGPASGVPRDQGWNRSLEGSDRWYARRTVVAAWACAACLLIGLGWMARITLVDATNQIAQTTPDDPVTTAALHQSLRQSGEAYLALARGITASVVLDERVDPSATRQQTVPANDRLLDDELFGGPPMSRVVRGSTATLLASGRAIGKQIQPVTRSCVGAFDFLWKPSANPGERPST